MKEYKFQKDSPASEIQQKLADTLQKHGIECRPSDVHLEHPNDNTHGDYASNVAMAHCKTVGKNPRDFASELVAEFNTNAIGLTAQIAGPGFINFKLDNTYLTAQINKIFEQKENWGSADIGNGQNVMIEFGQPNTHKAFHLGHLKSAISGLALVGLYKALGYNVIRANFYGDVGMHVAKCVWGFKSLQLPENWNELDEHGKMKFIDASYVHGSKMFKEDPNAEAEIREINKQIYAKTPGETWDLYQKTLSWSLDHLNSAFKELGVEYDVQYPESTVSDIAVKIVKENIGNVFEESDGAIVYKGEADGLNTWVFLTKEGIPTYSGKDLGLAYRKFSEYDLELGLVTTSVEQKDYFKAIIKVLEKIQPETTGRYKHIPFGWLLRSNKKMSSRMGDTIKGMDIIAEAKAMANELISAEKDYDEELRKQIVDAVAISGLKFLILSHEFHKDINYDPEKFISLSGFSGPYILYSYTRAQSLLRGAYEKSIQIKLGEFTHDAELQLARAVFKYPDNLVFAGTQLSPHLLCNYLYDLAQKFNQFYTECDILNAQSETMQQHRLALAAATAQVLYNGLTTLGMPIIDKM